MIALRSTFLDGVLTGTHHAGMMWTGLALTMAVALLLAPTAARAQALELVVGGLSSPLYATHSRDGSGRLFVVEQGGIVKVVLPRAGPPTIFLDISDRVLSGGEQGLLGLAFHPQFAANRRFFVNYTRRPTAPRSSASFERRRVPRPRRIRARSACFSPCRSHSPTTTAACSSLAPTDGSTSVWATVAPANDPDNHGQNATSLPGKMLRVDVDGGAPDVTGRITCSPTVRAAARRSTRLASAIRFAFRSTPYRRVPCSPRGPRSARGGRHRLARGNDGGRRFEGTCVHNPGLGPWPRDPSVDVLTTSDGS